MGFRCAYSLDGQGHDFTSSYAKKYATKKKKTSTTTTDPLATIPIPTSTKRPEFTRCAYSLDSQGHELSYPKEYSSSRSISNSSSSGAGALPGGGGEWRAIYDLGQRPIVHRHQSSSSSS